MKRVLILGAAGRDFHNFNVVFRHNPEYQVAAFTATQIPDIAGRKYPAELAGPLYPQGIPIVEEADMEKVIREREIDVAVFSYSDVAHQNLMHVASRVVAAGADFWLFGAKKTQLPAKVPVISVWALDPLRTRKRCAASEGARSKAVDPFECDVRPPVTRSPNRRCRIRLGRVRRRILGLQGTR